MCCVAILFVVLTAVCLAHTPRRPAKPWVQEGDLAAAAGASGSRGLSPALSRGSVCLSPEDFGARESELRPDGLSRQTASGLVTGGSCGGRNPAKQEPRGITQCEFPGKLSFLINRLITR